MSQPFVGQIIAVGFNFAPVGWQLCDGTLLPISQYDVLYTLLGTTYGGNGTTTFAVPDLRGRGALGMGQGTGLQTYVLGQPSGTENVTLTVGQIGAHGHQLMAATNATASTPTAGTVLGTPPTADPIYLTSGATTALANASISVSAGGNQPHVNQQPYLAVNYIIATLGIFPSQS